MNLGVLVAVAVAVVVVAFALLWIFLRPSTAEKKTAQLSVVPDPKLLPKPVGKAVKRPPESDTEPRVDVPENTSSTRWVGALIDKRPDEAAAVLKRWIREK